MNETIKQRLLSIDIVRGLIIVLMALDHTRDFFGAASFSPTDLSQTDAAWFFTRWITHFCAPLFVFLTGVSAYLYYQKTKCLPSLRHFLLTRGMWLIVVELVLINASWQFGFGFTFVQVIWVLGWSMIILAGLSYFSLKTILMICLPVVFLHNTINDQAIMNYLGDYGMWWMLLHQTGGFEFFDTGWFVYISYALLPWPALMGIGFVIGHWFTGESLNSEGLASERIARVKNLLLLGIACCVLFVVLRVTGWYGDTVNWTTAEDFGHPILSFLNTQKYPPSLQFLLMTIGPGLILLALLDGVKSDDKIYWWLKPFKVLGSVPMFFYLIHVPVINASAQIYSYFVYGKAVMFFYGPSVYPAGYEPSLWLTYIAWIVLTVILYIPCVYYAKLKSQSDHPIYSYV